MKIPKLFKALHNGTQKDACKECDYYISANGTCQSKKCSTGNPYVTSFDRKHCKPYHRTDMIGSRRTIDIDRSVNAHWIKQGREIFKCSNCGNYLDFGGVNAGRGDANYCPNCGAKMDE